MTKHQFLGKWAGLAYIRLLINTNNYTSQVSDQSLADDRYQRRHAATGSLSARHDYIIAFSDAVRLKIEP